MIFNIFLSIARVFFKKKTKLTLNFKNNIIESKNLGKRVLLTKI